MTKMNYKTPEMVIVAMHTEQQVLTGSNQGQKKVLQLMLFDEFMTYGGELSEEW